MFSRLFPLLIFIFNYFHTQGQSINFEKSFDTLGCYYGNCVKQTIDSGFILCGSRSASPGNNDAAIIKTDKYGDIQWVKYYGGFNVEGAITIEFINDTNYLVTGLIDGGTANNTLIWLLFLDSSGDTTRSKTIRIGGGTNRVTASVATHDGGYTLTGYTSVNSSSIAHTFLLKINNLGDTLWCKTYTIFDGDNAWGLNVTRDGGFVITGAEADSGQIADLFVIRTDSLGDLLWSQSFGYANVDVGNSIAQTTDGGFVVGGYSWNVSSNNYDTYLLKIDSMGVSQWDRYIGNVRENGIYNMQLLHNDELIFTGFTATQNNSYDVWLIKTTAIGDTIWSKTFGGINNDISYFVQETIDHGFIIVGESDSFSPNSVYLIKTDSLGSMLNYINDFNLPIVNIFPNPANDHFKLSFSEEYTNRLTYAIFDITGKIIIPYTSYHENGIINAENLLSGVYFISFNYNNFILIKKLIIQH